LQGDGFVILPLILLHASTPEKKEGEEEIILLKL
jgi:hypothetical protein